MTITFKKNRVNFCETAAGDDAEALLEWLQKYPKGKIDLSECTHLHPANLQVLMAARCSILVGPRDKHLADWINTALKPL